MAYVYRHIRTDKNVPFYIGIGQGDDNYSRAYSIKNRNTYWNNIVNTTAYEIEIMLDNLTNEEAFEKEKEFIQLYGKNTNGGTLCNIADGGNGGYLGEEVNQLRSQSLIGHKLSEETKEKLRLKATGRQASVETRKKMSEVHKENKTGSWLRVDGHYNGRAKKVYQYDLSGNLIKEWDCAAYACKELGIHQSCISEVIKGKQKTAGGFFWKDRL